MFTIEISVVTLPFSATSLANVAVSDTFSTSKSVWPSTSSAPFASILPVNVDIPLTAKCCRCPPISTMDTVPSFISVKSLPSYVFRANSPSSNCAAVGALFCTDERLIFITGDAISYIGIYLKSDCIYSQGYLCSNQL